MLTLAAFGKCWYPRLALAVATLPDAMHCEQSAISTSGSITRCSEREVAMFVSSNSDFSKLLIYSTQNYLLLKNISGQLIGTPYHLLAEMNKENPHAQEIFERNIFKTPFSFYKFSSVTMQA
jgi:hypothetical protein